jgi:hypothetical protein
MTRRRLWLVLAAVSLGGCLCPGDRTTQAAYAEMASYRPQIAACLARHACKSLCTDLFQLGDDMEIERCVITSLVRQDFTTQIGLFPSPMDLQLIRGANVQVTYAEQVPCDLGSDDGSTDDGWDDGWDDGSTDDGSTDDGSTDDGSTDDGSDDGSTDDGSDDGSDDGDWMDDGSGDVRAPTPGSVGPAEQRVEHPVGLRKVQQRSNTVERVPVRQRLE